MSLPSKVLWAEGLTVGPQQFQQADRYHEARLQRIAATINPHLWGVRSVRWNLDGLANNLLYAEEMSLIFQDGEVYEAPFADALPTAVDLSKLPAGEQNFTFYAALPAMKAHGGNLSVSDNRHGDARYEQAVVETLDLFTEALSIDVAFLKKTVRLVSHLESRTAYLSFPVARVRRTVTGAFEIDQTFMPPGLAVSADPALQRMLDSLLDKLSAKIEALYSRHRQPSKNAVEVNSGDMSSFWMLNTISTASATLTHCASYRHHHPENLFGKLMALAGGLLTFSRKYALADLPAYQHEDPGPGFARLDAIIRDLVDTVMLSKYFKIPLSVDEQGTHYRGLLDGAKIDRQTTLYIAVNADMPALELVATVPVRFKIAAPGDIAILIGRALPGVGLVHMAQVPAEVPVRPNTYYFSIENKGTLYETMIESQAIAIYAPVGMNGLKVELFGITA